MQIRNIHFLRGEKLKRIPDNPAQLNLRDGRCVANLAWHFSLADTAAAHALQEVAATDAVRVGYGPPEYPYPVFLGRPEHPEIYEKSWFSADRKSSKT